MPSLGLGVPEAHHELQRLQLMLRGGGPVVPAASQAARPNFAFDFEQLAALASHISYGGCEIP